MTTCTSNAFFTCNGLIYNCSVRRTLPPCFSADRPAHDSKHFLARSTHCFHISQPLPLRSFEHYVRHLPTAVGARADLTVFRKRQSTSVRYLDNRTASIGGFRPKTWLSLSLDYVNQTALAPCWQRGEAESSEERRLLGRSYARVSLGPLV